MYIAYLQNPFQHEFLMPYATNLCNVDIYNKKLYNQFYKIIFYQNRVYQNIYLNALAYEAPLNINLNNVSL